MLLKQQRFDMKDTPMAKTEIRNEGMRISGEVVFTDKVVEVLYPFTDEVIGTVPAGMAEHAARAFEIAANYTPKLSRYERSQILQRAGELIGEKRDWLAKWLTLELGICHQHAIYETKRAQDVYQFAAAQAMNDAADPRETQTREVVDEDVGDDVPRVIRLVHAQAHDALGAVGRELDAQRGGFTDRGEVGAPSPAARDGLPPPGDRVDLARGALGSIAVAFAEGGRVAFLEVVLLEAVHVAWGGRERQERHERHDRTPAPRAHGGWWRVLFWTIDRRGLRRQDGDLGFS